MYSFGRTSKERLKYVHPDLRLVCNEVIKIFDFSVLEGYRPPEVQFDYFKKGRVLLPGGNPFNPDDYKISDYKAVITKIDGINQRGKHNHKPSQAVDIAPYPIDWKKRERFFFLAGLIKATALQLKQQGKIGHLIRWGGDWDSDNDFGDQTFEDLPHFEIVT